MTASFFYLIPISLLLGTGGLLLFLWTMRNGQYEDLDGAAERILYGEDIPAASKAKQVAAEQVGMADKGPSRGG
ncbi:cbb3-type cytochrome oxidase assembly protein CcoS [Mycoplana rhizolycopersici]|jgi:cbb3-type cytochrome oxidase maturation protein|uniref:Cbb3-type cytochrome oxidase assembly protein CcoS n=1 Tax=Mycoplana rhizolycopersici TaxID=2746702 RepID=A0ABX2QIY2_9HYPH|nr:cbb3-type cytochrome oxidase assembly protein CcoS [Rhizobium rhizolycopersici]NVP57178.1 cbb3-type cytochrome oxidase assembly protein CcoS [Rhizobium rhizolycopersici]